jgi:hypothetical protein
MLRCAALGLIQEGGMAMDEIILNQRIQRGSFITGIRIQADVLCAEEVRLLAISSFYHW